MRSTETSSSLKIETKEWRSSRTFKAAQGAARAAVTAHATTSRCAPGGDAQNAGRLARTSGRGRQATVQT
ncbi:hypothetical protein [Nonomuraea sp. NPDC049028]|uniref:hypothetical protein n=1 Tax=Nonomuraea sp. NPDC049028 TaxID=3364348 RepID=UPI003722B5EC